jgi:hypothetical protein
MGIYNGYAAQNHGDHVKPYARQSLAERPTPGPWPHHSEGPQPQPQSEASSPVPPMGEWQSWSDASHEQLVQAFRTLINQGIQEEIQQTGGRYATAFPAKIIRGELGLQQSRNATEWDRQKASFYAKIHNAWDVVAFEHFPDWAHEGSAWEQREGDLPMTQQFAADNMSRVYQRALAMGEPRPELIKLDPQQVKILDALAEATDIPHQHGQAAIEIPERFRYYRRHRYGPDGKLII